MKCLSIRQPWADAIIHFGKDIENRDWPTRFRGLVLIHAGKAFGRDEHDDVDTVKRMIGRAPYQLLQKPLLGGIVGIAEIVDCVTESDSKWFFGKYGFVIRNARSLPFIPMKGALGFFEATDTQRSISDEYHEYD